MSYHVVDDSGGHKPVPAMALLPILQSTESSVDSTAAGVSGAGAMVTPRPPSGAPPAKTSTGIVASRKLVWLCIHLYVYYCRYVHIILRMYV